MSPSPHDTLDVDVHAPSHIASSPSSSAASMHSASPSLSTATNSFVIPSTEVVAPFAHNSSDSLDEKLFYDNTASSSTTSSLKNGEKDTYPPSSDLEQGDEYGAPTLVGEDEAPPVPDGGLRAWLNVLGGWLILFSTFGMVSAWGCFQAYYQLYVYRTESSSTISWVGSTQLCLFFLMALVAGPLFDRGYFRQLIGVGSALWVTSILLTPQAKSFGQTMAIQGILGGVGVGLLFLPALSIQSHWFARRRNLAVGIVASGSSIGGICFPIMLNKLFANPHFGFAAGVRTSGYVVAACLLIANVIMSPNADRKNIRKPKMAPIKSLFTVPYTCLVVGAAVMNFGLWFPNFYIELYAKTQGMDTSMVVYMLAIFNAGSFFGRTIPNLIADRTGPYLVQMVCCALAGVVLFLMHLASSSASLIAFAIVYGFLSGGFISLVSPVVVALSSDLSEIGLRQGIAFLIVAGAAVGGNPIAGKLLANSGGDFLQPIIFAGTTVLAGAAMIFVGYVSLVRSRGTWKV